MLSPINILLHLDANHRRSIGALASFIFLFSVTAVDADTTSMGRYIDTSIDADYEQLWPLVKTASPDNQSCANIRCAVNKVIGPVGYSIYSGAMNVSAINTLNKPVPANHQRFDNIQIIEIVHALMGPAYQILVDPYDRLISFDTSRPQALTHAGGTVK